MRIVAFLFFLNLGMFFGYAPAFSLFTDYSKQPFEQNVQDLTEAQINNPMDPYINYNLGVAFYQSDKFDAAKNNFQRALLYAKNNNLKERAHFNLANSCYKQGISMLPPRWQDKNVDIDQKKLMDAIQQVQESIKSYKNVMEINSKNEHAKTNLNTANVMLKKLQEKLNHQKNNNENKDKNKDNNQNEDNHNQSGQQNQQNENQQSDSPNKNEQQSTDGQQSSDSGKEGENKQNQEQQPTQDNQKSSDNSGDNADSRDQDKSNQDKAYDKEQQDFKHNENQSKQRQEHSKQEQISQQEEQNQEQPKQKQTTTLTGQNGNEQESMQQKSIRAMLDNLQSYESNLQKVKILQKTKGDQKPLNTNQKPW